MKSNSKKNLEYLYTPTNYVSIHPALKGYFGYCLVKSAIKFKYLLSQELSKHDVGGPELGIMRFLHLLGPMSQITLSQDLGIDKASMVKFIDSLEKKKWVLRAPDKKDRRIKLVGLTKKGEDALVKLTKIHKGVVENFLSPLNEKERAQLKELVSKLS